MSEMRDLLYDLMRRLLSNAATHRIKRATLYLTVVDQDGNEVLLDPTGEWEISLYDSAADEHGI